jgi:hypothetical protein
VLARDNTSTNNYSKQTTHAGHIAEGVFGTSCVHVMYVLQYVNIPCALQATARCLCTYISSRQQLRLALTRSLVVAAAPCYCWCCCCCCCRCCCYRCCCCRCLLLLLLLTAATAVNVHCCLCRAVLCSRFVVRLISSSIQVAFICQHLCNFL